MGVMQNIGSPQFGDSGPLPSQQLKESQVRPLVALPPSDQKKAWETAVKSSQNGKPTAKQVAEAVAAIDPLMRIINFCPCTGVPDGLVRNGLGYLCEV